MMNPCEECTHVLSDETGEAVIVESSLIKHVVCLEDSKEMITITPEVES